MKPTGIFKVLDRLPQLMQQTLKLPDRKVLVGIPSDKVTREAGEPINNAEIGYIAERGSPVNNIPARPWLVPGIKSVQPRITALFRKAGLAAVNGDAQGVEVALNAAGLVAVSGAQRRITTGPFAPLAAGTLAARRRRGRTGTKPLIDTGQFRRSVSYVIREKD